MSAARSPRRRAVEPTRAAVPADIAELHARRRRARRKRRLARVDVGVGGACALVLLIASPGLAITGLIAALVLLACVVSILLQRRARRRAEEALRARRRNEEPDRDRPGGRRAPDGHWPTARR